jgi:hypothetical protein
MLFHVSCAAQLWQKFPSGEKRQLAPSGRSGRSQLDISPCQLLRYIGRSGLVAKRMRIRDVYVHAVFADLHAFDGPGHLRHHEIVYTVQSFFQ